MSRILSYATAALIAAGTLHAADRLETITVESLQETIEKQGKVKDVVEKTEVISRKEIEQQQAGSLIEAVQQSSGVSVTTNCSMCGIKRVMLNGMKGEHTTVLVDGVPFHSTVSSYYGMDAIGTGDVESIEVARGSGASLTSPEAIGGTLNIVSRRARKNGAEFDFAAGEQGYRIGSFVGEGITTDKKSGVLLAGSYSNTDQYDRDKNGVNEAPKLENQSFSVNIFHEPTARDLLEMKASHTISRVFGGPMVAKSGAFSQFGLTGSAIPGFAGGDVRGAYIGDPMGTLEKIDTTRDEAIGTWTHTGEQATIRTTLACAVAGQASMYEGTDYHNRDKTMFADVKIAQPVGESHFLTYGSDVKREIMKARSSQFVATADSNGHDDFNYVSLGAYVQDSWTMSDKAELDMAVRAARITTDFTGQYARGNEVDATIAVPRLYFRYNHSAALTSRISAGQGYRSPLTFFESEHGLIGPSGFAVRIDRIERSDNATYALSYDLGPLSVTASAAYTKVKNLAHIINDAGKPTLVNDSRTVTVKNADIVAGYAVTPTLSLSGAYEQYWYDTDYKELLYVAAVEKRARVMVDWDVDGWDIVTQATWTGSRDLVPYGYADRYDDAAHTSVKNTKAPSFTTVDVKVSRELSSRMSLYAGVKNLFDTTQTAKQSPLFYDKDGNYDVGYIWGPLRGRLGYAGIKLTF